MILRLIAGALVAFGIVKFARPLPTDEEIDERLRNKAAMMNQGLDPINSIVDFLKTLELESSSEARRELWVVLGCGPATDYVGSADQNRTLISEMRLQLKRGDFADRL